MRKISIILTPIFIFAKVHYAKLEPYETITLKSAISAQVTQSDISLEGKVIRDRVIIKLDSKLDRIKLSFDRKALELIKKMLVINKDNLLSTAESIDRKESYYNRIKDMQTISTTKKDSAFYSLINTKKEYLSIKERMESLKKQKLDLLYDIERLKDNISKKSIRVKNRFIDKLLVHKGDFVNMGTPLVRVRDLTKGKLTLFLEDNELEDIKSKKVYINDKLSRYKISKIWKVTDDKFISSYRAEIIIDNPKWKFSKLLKIELR